MANGAEAETPFEKFLSGSLAIVGGLFGMLIMGPSDSSLAVGIAAGIFGMIGYYVGLQAAKLITAIILIVLTLIVYSFRRDVFHAIFSVLFGG